MQKNIGIDFMGAIYGAGPTKQKENYNAKIKTAVAVPVTMEQIIKF